MDNQVEDLQELEDANALEESVATIREEGDATPEAEAEAMDASFMSESIYQKLPSQSPKKRPHKNIRKAALWNRKATTNALDRAEINACSPRTPRIRNLNENDTRPQ